MTQPPSSETDTPWWKGAVVYQVYPRSFRDTSGDGIGDLQGIIDGLDHIASLGVDAVWLSPFFPSPMKDFGYDVADYCGVDEMFGTLDDFDRLIDKAHRLGLKIIIDQVYSHTSDEHTWFVESRESRTSARADWYVWADPKPDGSPPNNWQSVFGGPAWEWDGRRQQYYLHNFLVSQPDLNLHNEAVQAALVETARFWLDRGVDGFRLDAINFAMHNRQLTDNPPSGLPMDKVTRPFDMQRHVHQMSQPQIPAFLERIRAAMAPYGDTFTVAEVVGPEPIGEMKAFTQGDTCLTSAYSFDFLYAQSLSPGRVARSLGQWTGAPGEGWPSWAFSNHDAPRAVTRWAAPQDRETAASMLHLLLLALRGNPFIYQGEELGLPQAHVPFEHLKDPEAIANWPRTLGRDGARTPIPWSANEPNAGFSEGTPWLPTDPAHAGLAIDTQQDDPGSSLNRFRSLVRLRRRLPALRLGTMRFLDAPGNILAFERQHGGETVTCVYNSGEADARFSPPGAEALEIIATETGASTEPTSVPDRLGPWQGYWARRPAG